MHVLCKKSKKLYVRTEQPKSENIPTSFSFLQLVLE